MNKETICLIFAHSVEPNGISGSESILIELFKRVASSFKQVTLYTWRPGERFYKEQGLHAVKYKVSQIPVIRNFYLSFFLRSLHGFWLGMRLKVQNPSSTLLYPGSDFWPDAIPALLVKLRYPQTFLLATYYLTAPNPFRGFDETGKWHLPRLNTIFYWLMQKPVYLLYKVRADAVVVTSEPDVAKFPRQKSKKRVFVVRGGVDLDAIHHYSEKTKSAKHYDAVYMGRFHPQKGVLELVDIWQIVTKTLPQAKLAMIGDGALMGEVKDKIKKYHLEQNIVLQGYILQPEKRYALFSQSKIVVHPAIYDSGGMSAAEVMAFGLPAVSFDLQALKTYYPHGMLKVPLGEKAQFAQKIIDLLTDHRLYTTVGREAKEDIVQYWSWNTRAEEFLHFLRSNCAI